jgi:CubicO group peptidase (beta-lactamase class C family)
MAAGPGLLQHRSKPLTLPVEPTMITRRTMLQAAAIQGIVGCVGVASAQQPKKRKLTAKKKVSKDLAVYESDPRVQDILAPIRDKYHLPGLMGALLIGDRLATIGAVGIRKIGSALPIRVTDQVHIGSCTKAMTATMIGTLVEEERLTWGSTIREVFPEVAPELDDDFQKVTLNQLLTHRSGLPANAPWGHLVGGTTTEQRYSLLIGMMSRPPQSRPGSTYEYSNVGYALAGLMAEQATGQSWEVLMQRRLFDPLGMSSAGFGPPGRAGTVEQPWGHRAYGGEIRPIKFDNPAPLGPAGIVHCSIPDWTKFVALHLAASRGKAKLLKLSTFRVLQNPAPGSEYAGGWNVVQRSWADGRTLYHTGSNTAWMVALWMSPARNFAVLTATNQGGDVAATGADEAASALIRAIEFLA